VANRPNEDYYQDRSESKAASRRREIYEGEDAEAGEGEEAKY